MLRFQRKTAKFVFTEATNRTGSGGKTWPMAKDKKKILPSNISDYNIHFWRRRHVFIFLGFFGVLYVHMDSI
jgi:hypothetical protein